MMRKLTPKPVAGSPLAPGANRVAAWQAATLAVLAVVLFWPVLSSTVGVSFSGPDSAHALAIMAMITILLVRRRSLFAATCRRGSPWGLVLILLSLLAFAIMTWPFSFAYPRRLAVAPAFVGIALATGGWRVMLHVLPLILLLLIAIPIGSRYWVFLIIKPETVTLDAIRVTLDMLPGVTAELEGLDITYSRGSSRGSVALGESQRGASLLLSSLAIGVFVTFVRVRLWWKVLISALAAGPIVLFVNYVRLMVRGLITIYTDADPLSLAPRAVSTALSLLLAYGLFVLLLALLDQVAPDPARGTKDDHA